MNVLLLGDGIALTSGFAQVLRRVAAELVGRGHHVAQIAALDTPPRCDAALYRARQVEPYFPRWDEVGAHLLPEVVDQEQPDVIILNTDPGQGYNWLRRLELTGHAVPTVLYAPVEGAPVHPQYLSAFRMATRSLTYTRWGSERLLEEGGLTVPWEYHGVDTETFRPLTEAERRDVRQRLGWEGRYVVAYVGRNQGRKAQDRLIRALALMRERGVTDVTLYLHCLPFDNFLLEGWDLQQLATSYGVADIVQFARTTGAVTGESGIGLARKLAAVDLYVHPAKVEGFGLPLLEAMACGLPVVVTADGGVMEEVVGERGAMARIAPSDIETWFNGARLANLAPELIAAVIGEAMARPELCATARRHARARALEPCFRWEPMARRIVDLAEECASVREDTWSGASTR